MKKKKQEKKMQIRLTVNNTLCHILIDCLYYIFTITYLKPYSYFYKTILAQAKLVVQAAILAPN